jgi:hypothetical protein
MRKPKKVQGFNPKEQKVYEMLADGEPHSFAEMKKLFAREARNHCPLVYNAGWGDHEVDVQAQSMARNSVRRLLRDGWAEQCARGTYRLTRTGKTRRDRGEDKTPSFGTKRGRPASTDKKKKKKTTKKASAKKAAPKKKKTTKKAAPKKKASGAKKKPASKKTSKKAPAKQAAKKKTTPKKAAKASKGNGVKAKAQAAAKRAKKVAAQEKAAAASERAKKAAKTEATEAAPN